MPFTISDAKMLAESWFDNVIDEYFILIWSNEFLQRIVSNKLWTDTTQTFPDSVAETWYSLPTGFVKTVMVEDSDKLNCKRYAIKNGKIKFDIDGSYTLTYTQYPSAMTSLTANLPLPDVFQYPLAEFFTFKYYNVADNDSAKDISDEYEQRYKASLKNIYGNMEINSETESFQIKMRW